MENNCLGTIHTYRGQKCIVVATNCEGKPTLLMGLEPLKRKNFNCFTSEVNWFDVLSFKEELQKNGFGWKLLTKNEMSTVQIFLNGYRSKLPSTLQNKWLWTTTEYDNGRAWDLDMANGSFFKDPKERVNSHLIALPFFQLKWKNLELFNK